MTERNGDRCFRGWGGGRSRRNKSIEFLESVEFVELEARWCKGFRRHELYKLYELHKLYELELSTINCQFSTNDERNRRVRES